MKKTNVHKQSSFLLPPSHTDEYQQLTHEKVLKKNHLKDYSKHHKYWNDDVWDEDDIVR